MGYFLLFPKRLFSYMALSARRTRRRIFTRIVVYRNAQRDARALPFAIRYRAELRLSRFELAGKGISVFEVLVLQNCGEFITADAEDRAMLERLTDEVARGFQVLIALFMSELVVDFLQVVAIEHAHGEIRLLAAVDPFLNVLDVLVESALVAHGCQSIDIHPLAQIVDQALFFAGFPLRANAAQQQQQDDQQHNGDDRHHDEQVVLYQIAEIHTHVFGGIVGQRRVYSGAGNRVGDARQDGIQLRIALADRQAIIHIHAGVHRGQVQLLALLRYVAVTVVANDDAIGLACRHSFEARGRIGEMRRLPARIVVDQKHFVVGVAFVDGHDHIVFADEFLLVRLAHHGIHFRPHQRRCHDHAQLFSVIVGQIGGEHAINLAFFQRLHRRCRSRVSHGFEVQRGVFQPIGGVGQKVLQRASQLARFLVCSAKRQIVVLIAHPYGSMTGKPLQLVGVQVSVRFRVSQVLLVQLLVVEPVFFLDSAHCGIQLVQQFGIVLAHHEEEIG